MDEAAGTIISVEGSAAFENVIRDKTRLAKLIDDEQQGGLLAGLVIPGVDYVRSLRIRAAAQRAMADFFTRYDALVAPGMLQVAPPLTASLGRLLCRQRQGPERHGQSLRPARPLRPDGLRARTICRSACNSSARPTTKSRCCRWASPTRSSPTGTASAHPRHSERKSFILPGLQCLPAE